MNAGAQLITIIVCSPSDV